MDRIGLKSRLAALRSEQNAIVVARAVARAIPFASHVIDKDDDAKATLLFSARAVLAAMVVAKLPGSETRLAAKSASNAALKLETSVYDDGREHRALKSARSAMSAKDVLSAARRSAEASTSSVGDIVGARAAEAVSDAARFAGQGLDPRVADQSSEHQISSDLRANPDELFNLPLWDDGGEPDWLIDFEASLDGLLEGGGEWTFWRGWYRGMIAGQPLDWELQRRVALIPDEDWGMGVEHIAQVIEKIEREWRAESQDQDPSHDLPVSSGDKDVVVKNVIRNREALALSIAAVLEQLVAYRERIRGLNHLAADLREEILEFVDRLSDEMERLLHSLPQDDARVSDEQAEGYVLWLREFKPLLRKKAAKYLSPENVADATVPTGIILGCTVVGSLVGGPTGAGVGALVGGLITNQVKPGKAAEVLASSGDEPPISGD